MWQDWIQPVRLGQRRENALEQARRGLLNDTPWAERKHWCARTTQREAIQSYLDKSRVSLYLRCFTGENTTLKFQSFE